MSKSFTRGYGLLELFLTKKRAEKASVLLPKSLDRKTILDIGCGKYPYFLSVVDFENKYGVDPSLSTEKLERGRVLKRLNIENTMLPFPDNFFNAVTMLAVFEHIDKSKLPVVLKEIRRVVKMGGVFIITTPAPWSDKLLHLMAKFRLISAEEIYEHKHNMPSKKIESLLLAAGFTKKKLKNGYFELGFNMWSMAEK